MERLLDLIERPVHLRVKADDLPIGHENGEVTVGGKLSEWLLDPVGRDTFLIRSAEERSHAWFTPDQKTPARVLLGPPTPVLPGAPEFRFVPVAGEEDTYEILHGDDKGIGVYKPNQTTQQPLTLLGAPSAYRILVTPA
ncbi:hypothetical protein [Streptomyces lavenduligriseus]|uniref:Uncharacterized protein n=1 Tax=Streptomyces lavenduligriseus TaxID=67315 RepID=A0ABT0P4P5_9ACTN|nr:hypothetical protein [Streptomyces lavenduligriseus]MCL3998719.1 hypothetical protein [Streptomyces lavenduligriseus]